MSLQDCASCGRPFVVPVDLLDVVDEGLFLLALWCASCDHVTVGEVEDADLEALDAHLAATTAQMRAEADALLTGVDPAV